MPEKELEIWKLSPSQMNVYNHCPRQWHFSYVVGIKKQQKNQRYFEWGNYWHELMHVMYQLIQQGHVAGSDFVINSMHSRIRKDIADSTEDSISIIHDVTKAVNQYIAVYSPMIDKGITVIGVENNLVVPATTDNGNKFLLNCITDLLYRTESGKLTVRDHKSGQAGSWSARMIPLENQLLFNAAAYFLLTGEMPLRVEISFVNSYQYKNKVPTIKERFDILPFTHNETTILNYIKELYKFVDTALNDTDPRRNYSKDCGKCQFNEICTQEIRGFDSTSLIRTQFEKVERDYEVRLKHRTPSSESPNQDSANDKKPFSLHVDL